MKIAKDIKIYIDKDLKEMTVFKKALVALRKVDQFELSTGIITIFIDSKNYSDLFISDDWEDIRRCTDKEWGYYFKNVLND